MGDLESTAFRSSAVNSLDGMLLCSKITGHSQNAERQKSSAEPSSEVIFDMKAREFAPLIVFERKADAASIDSLAGAKESKDALKEVLDSLDKVVLGESLEKPGQDDLRTVLEQDIDTNVYDSAEYEATVTYGSTTQQVAYTYKGLSHDGKEANSASYDVNVSTVEETKLHGRLKEVHEAAKNASQMGRVAITDLDPVQKNAKQEMAMRHGPTFSFLQYALLGKIDFL